MNQHKDLWINRDKLNELFYDKDRNQLDFQRIFYYLDHSYEGLVLTDHEGRLLYANHAVERISGLPLSEMIGFTMKELEEKGIIINQSIKVLKKTPLTITQKLITGKEVFITSQPVIDENGHILGYIANYRDLNEINELHQEHQRQKDIDYIELQELRKQLLNTNSFITRNIKMKQMLERAIKVAKTNATVLIRGESGTGKEEIAKIIHKMSNRADKPYIPINCGAIPESLIESELFGHVKGAFTGADKNKIGLLEVANGGTVLLDEIGDLPIHLQVKLLRVIQTKEFYPVGSHRPKVADIRFLAATHRNLEEMIKNGYFREDLFYRLNVVPISIPPLRERKEDIIPLACYFLEKYNQKYSCRKKFDVATIRAMENYEWPGNVRHLENVIERMVIMAEGDIIEPHLLPEEIQLKTSHAEIPKMIDNELLYGSLQEALEQLEKAMITQALQTSRSIREAAKRLKINHSTLIRKIRKYKIHNN
ncbi:diguanylate cyclase [Parageobacillus thermoglucosidasius]|uniref:sigma-54 interaction domain-containing protein n=1 Tax=Parageobacillus thermoglucosidasius TaxID=1426 RepID=UPI000F628081|nr:sigma 54-interacting transcriptional regulator [Parageobacillus thermoglucosidasius]GCD84768.1 diguanylate cyclase [Parageobacillus thermoglucosidasius]